MIRRARHGDYQPFQVDNRYLWSVMWEMFKDPSPAWPWISAFQRSMNGRAAYLALADHYLGPTNKNQRVAEANAMIERSSYDGNKRNFTLGMFFGNMKKSFNTLVRHKEGLSEHRKIQIVTDKCLDPRLESTVRVVRALPETYTTVEKAMNYITEIHQGIVRQAETLRKVAASETTDSDTVGGGKYGKDKTGKGPKKGRKNGDDESDLARTYTAAEWHALTQEEKEAVREARQKRKKPKRQASVTARGEGDTEEETPAQGAREGSSVGATITRRRGAVQG
jgi:hypothetical protein